MTSWKLDYNRGVDPSARPVGTLRGGWRIVHTLGSKITKLQPIGGFAVLAYGALQVAPATGVAIIGLAGALSWSVPFLIRKRRDIQATVFAPPA